MLVFSTINIAGAFLIVLVLLVGVVLGLYKWDNSKRG